MNHSPKKIIIVEDNMILSMVLERMIQELGHEIVDNVTSGKKAIKSAIQLKPDLILMDIQLADNIDGISAIKQIKARSDVDVIYITGNSDEYYLSQAKETNFVDYLVKPVHMHDLKESINLLVGNTEF